MDAYNSLRKPSLGAPGHVTNMLQTQNVQKVDDFEPIYVRSSQLEYYFSFFLLFFLFLFRLSTFKPLNALHSKFKQLKISGRTNVGLKSRVPGWGDPPQLGPPKFSTFKLLEQDGSNVRNG